MNKQAIKHLSEDIFNELNAHAYAQEMDALVDYGEFSSRAPDLSAVEKKWNLSRYKLPAILHKVRAFRDKHFDRMVLRKPLKPWDSPEYCNPWYFIEQNLQQLFAKDRD